ncbi:MAG: hypothetical protein EOM76_07210 [Sphingobacteriia bacterium]|nr:hypothetical protein [Sphingobacteriia bacterium]
MKYFIIDPNTQYFVETKASLRALKSASVKRFGEEVATVNIEIHAIAADSDKTYTHGTSLDRDEVSCGIYHSDEKVSAPDYCIEINKEEYEQIFKIKIER